MNKLQHISIIPDGNRRYALKYKTSLRESYSRGLNNIIDFSILAKRYGIKEITFFVLSQDNYEERSKEELKILLSVGKMFLKRDKKLNQMKRHFKICFYGNFKKLPEDLLNEMDKTAFETRNNKGMTINLLINYDGKQDLIYAANWEGINNFSFLNKKDGINSFSERLQTSGIHDLDLIIRTGGRKRLSGLLPWQACYAELFFLDCLWGEFKLEDFEQVLNDYKSIQRNFGK